MTGEQGTALAVLALTAAFFLWGRWRHDLVAVAALLACVFTGLVPAGEAFNGFAHPAVITVAAVLILSRSLLTSGAVDLLAGQVLPANAGSGLTIVALTALGAGLSAFMNNVGALAMLMPIALQVARQHDLPPGKVLMPLAFGSILGGMTTLIGTPPNLIVAGFRARVGEGGFGMFDFTPVGLVVAAVGVAFVIAARRLVPSRQPGGVETFETAVYLTEARVTKGKAVGMTLREMEAALEEAHAQIVGLVRNEVRISAFNPLRRLRESDILIIEAEPDSLPPVLSGLGLRLEEAEALDGGQPSDEPDAGTGAEPRKPPEKSSEEPTLMEFAVLPGGTLAGRSASEIGLRTRYGVNLLAVSRQGDRSISRLRTLPIREGDVLLMQGPPENLGQFATDYGCVPLAQRSLRLPERRTAFLAMGLMAAAVATAATGLVPAAISFTAAVLLSVLFGVMQPRSLYAAVDWPVIVLLGALFPVAAAMESTGAAALIARLLLVGVAQGEPVIALAVILVVTMTLSDFMNNAATAAVMCPIAIGTARALEASADPFLMAVAIGASCAFLTPIGHQNNTLILGPGGFRFSDYWRLGLPLELLILAVAVPMLLLVWPL